MQGMPDEKTEINDSLFYLRPTRSRVQIKSLLGQRRKSNVIELPPHPASQSLLSLYKENEPYATKD